MLLNLFMALGISFGLNLMFFIFAYLLKSDIFTDITYSMTFLLTTIIIMVITSSYNVISFILLALIALWSIRLGSYLLIRIWKTKVDRRFNNMRDKFWKFGAFWFLQAITVWLVNMPTYVSLNLSENKLKYWTIVFVILALLFLLYETIADLQKWKWIKNNPGKFIRTGLWKNSRHPNYFGEYSFWWMIFIFSIVNSYDHLKWVGIIGPIFITFILYKLSGLPLLEKGGLKRYGKDKEYIKYLNNTPTIIPFIGRKGYKKSWEY